MSDSCALDVAERGRHTQVVIGRLLGITKQRVEQIERIALAKLAEVDADLEDAIGCFPHPEELR
jgi:DNA-directed RNA polymerase sigma subunit (sigma70/sigma32)